MTKSVGVVCSTYRQPDKDNFIRSYGVISLIDQMMNQNYDGDIRIALVDDSPEPHIFAQEVSNAHPEKLLYLHATTRMELREKLLNEYPTAAIFVPSDEILANAALKMVQNLHKEGQPVMEADLKLARGDFDTVSPDEWDSLIGRKEGRTLSPNVVEQFLASHETGFSHDDLFWAERLTETRFFANFVPFEEDYPFQTNIFQQIFGERPTIGMKKNVGNASLADRFGDYDAIVYADDDDQHSLDYVAKSIEALDDKDFVRMTRYLTYIASDADLEKPGGIFDLKVQTDGKGYWYLPKVEQDRTMHMWLPEGRFEDKRIGSKFSRPVSVAWPIISHEGALHTFSYDIWKNSVAHCGGASPVSFCEDIIYYRRLRDSFGNNFRDGQVPIAEGEEQFIRIADGNNASIIETMELVDVADMPEWAQDAIYRLQSFREELDLSDNAIHMGLAEMFLEDGCCIPMFTLAETQHPSASAQPA